MPMPRPKFSLKSMFAATTAVAVLCWSATINPLFALLLVYAGIGAVYVPKRR